MGFDTTRRHYFQKLGHQQEHAARFPWARAYAEALNSATMMTPIHLREAAVATFLLTVCMIERRTAARLIIVCLNYLLNSQLYKHEGTHTHNYSE